jgi:LysR family transcriptional regulator, hca operon transcriptional activator
MISSQYSPVLANALLKGTVDAAFLRRERGVPDLAFRLLVKEPLVVILPSDHRLATHKAINPADLVHETFVTVSDTAPVLRVVIDNYLKRCGLNITPAHEADHVTMGISLIISTRGVGLLPAYARNFLPRSVTSRPLKGDTPTIDLVCCPQTFAFEIGRVGRSCLEAGAVSLVTTVLEKPARERASIVGRVIDAFWTKNDLN